MAWVTKQATVASASARRIPVTSPPRPRGLLLLEACLALAMVSIAFVAILRSFSQTILVVERTRDTARALRLLEEQALYAIAGGGVAPAGDRGALETPGWRWVMTTAPVHDTASHLLMTDIAIQWSSGRRAHTLTATTWLPPNDE